MRIRRLGACWHHARAHLRIVCWGGLAALAACASGPGVQLQLTDSAGNEIAKSLVGSADQLVRVQPGQRLGLSASGSSNTAITDITIDVPADRLVAPLNQQISSSSPSGGTSLAVASGTLKPMARGTYFPIYAALADDRSRRVETGKLTLVAGDVRPVIGDVARAPNPAEVGKPVTLTWTIKDAISQELSGGPLARPMPLGGQVTTATVAPMRAGRQTMTLSATSLTGTTVRKTFTLNPVPPVTCRLDRPTDQRIELRRLSNNQLVGAPLVGGFSNPFRTVYGEAVTTPDKAQAVVHEIRARILFAGQSIDWEEHRVHVFDLRSCRRVDTVNLGRGISLGKLQILTKDRRNWLAFTTIDWSGSTASTLKQNVNARVYELSASRPSLSGKTVRLKGVPYNNGQKSFFVNDKKDRVAIISMAPPVGNMAVRPYYAQYFDFTRPGAAVRETCIALDSAGPLGCARLYPPQRVRKKTANYGPPVKGPTGSPAACRPYVYNAPKKRATGTGPAQCSPYTFNPQLPRYSYDFSPVLTSVTLSGDMMSVTARGVTISANGTQAQKTFSRRFSLR